MSSYRDEGTGAAYLGADLADHIGWYDVRGRAIASFFAETMCLMRERAIKG